MTAKVVNLRRFRKTVARREKAAQAAENRQQFGRSKADKTSNAAALRQQEKALDGRRLSDPAGDDANHDADAAPE
jgi:hypothetical protein